MEVLPLIGENTKFGAMDPRSRAEKVVALTAIKKKAIDMAKKGMDPLGVQTFVQGARKKLTEERPDPEAYRRAAAAAAAAKQTT